MASLRRSASSGDIPSVSEVVLTHHGPSALPSRVSIIETSPNRIRGFNASIQNWILHIQTITKLREFVSGLTHCVGGVLAIIGLVLLVATASSPFRPWHLVTFTFYGTSMVLLYTISMLFHWLPLSEKGILRLRRLDHIMIFVFIAATYTPFCLIPFRGALGWSIFACIWAMAALGGVFKMYWIHVPKWLCLTPYFFAGCFAFIATGPIIRTLQPWAIFWLIAGGIFYSIGALFYALDKPEPTPRLIGYHDIFHVFVILGSIAHFWVIYRYINVFN